MGRLENKVAVVVGGGQTPGQTIGNGRATCVRFAQENATVLVVDLHEDRAAATADEIVAAGDKATALAVDVRSESACKSLIDTAVERYGRIDVLHNNIGIGAGDRGATSISEEVWDRIFATNLKAIMFCCKHVLPVMRQQGGGVITNISSVAAVCAVGMTAYKTSKAALNAYSHALATGNARHNIRVNVIMPGLMNTPMAIEGNVAAGRDREQVVASRDASVPLRGGMGSAWDVANAALFLASDEAGFITGVNLPVDGGQSAQIG